MVVNLQENKTWEMETEHATDRWVAQLNVNLDWQEPNFTKKSELSGAATESLLSASILKVLVEETHIYRPLINGCNGWLPESQSNGPACFQEWAKIWTMTWHESSQFWKQPFFCRFFWILLDVSFFSARTKTSGQRDWQYDTGKNIIFWD